MPKTADQRVQAAAERKAASEAAAAKREADRKAVAAVKKAEREAAKNAKKLTKAVEVTETAKLSRQRADSLLANQGKALNAGITQSVSAESLVGRVSGAVGERAQGELRQAAGARIAASVAGVYDIATTNPAVAIRNAHRAEKKAAMAASGFDPATLEAALTEKTRADQRAREEAARAEANKFSFAKLFKRIGDAITGMFSRKPKADVVVQNPVASALPQAKQDRSTSSEARALASTLQNNQQPTPSSTPRIRENARGTGGRQF